MPPIVIPIANSEACATVATKYSFLVAAACLCLLGCQPGQPIDDDAMSTAVAPKTDHAIVTFCSACHPMPNPASFVKDRWHHEVQQGIDLYRKSLRTDLVIPDFDATLAWFEEHAPDRLAFETPDPSRSEPSQLFHPIEVPIRGAEGDCELTAVSHVSILSAKGEPFRFALADMRDGYLWSATQSGERLQMESIGRVANPAHIEPADLDGDGAQDFVVADLGGFFPNHNKRGSLWWFRRLPDGSWTRIALKMGMMRVADVRIADFDQDGDQDLVVAEFGMHFHGGIHLLTNVGNNRGVPQFESEVLDERPGSIHLPTTDLNGDGWTDFVALISQHHETVVAFLNNGDATFRRETIHEAGDPAYGSSGIELVDLDRDGDTDVLLSNGDTFDDEIAKPSHSVQWLENQGQYPYQHHHVGQMPGAYRAVAGDIDGDDDIDIAAVALLVESNLDDQPAGTFDGVVYFEQTDGGEFVRHRLQVDRCDSATCQLIDWDADGDLDVATFPYRTSTGSADSITIFRNDI